MDDVIQELYQAVRYAACTDDRQILAVQYTGEETIAIGSEG